MPSASPAAVLLRALPLPLRRLLGLVPRRLVIDLAAKPPAVIAMDGVVPRSRVALPEQGTEAAAMLRRLAGARWDEIVLRLGGDAVLATELRLPRAAARNLAAVIPFEIERATPFAIADAAYDYAVVKEEAEWITVRLQVAPKAEIAAAAARLAPAGIAADRVLAGDDADLDRFGSLLPPALRPAPRSAGRRAGWAIAALALAAAVVSPFAQIEAARRALKAELTGLPRGAGDAARGGDSNADRARRAAAARAATPPVSLLLEEMAKLLPDDAWAVQFNWSERQVEIEGVSRSAAQLVPRLEASPLLGRVTFLTPLVRDPVSGAERFHFGIALKGAAP